MERTKKQGVRSREEQSNGVSLALSLSLSLSLSFFSFHHLLFFANPLMHRRLCLLVTFSSHCSSLLFSFLSHCWCRLPLFFFFFLPCVCFRLPCPSLIILRCWIWVNAPPIFIRLGSQEQASPDSIEIKLNSNSTLIFNSIHG